MKSKIFKTPLPYLALLVAHVIWGVNFVVAKITLDEFPPMSLAFLRFAFAAILMVPFFLTLEKKHKKIKLEHLPKFLVTGIFLVGINLAFFYEGIKRTTAIDASALTLIVPVVSLIGSWWFLKEKIYWINLVGILFGLLGAMTIVGVPLIFFDSWTGDNLLGNVLIILSSISFVVGVILSKELLALYPTITITTILFAVGAVSFFIPAALEYLNNPFWVQNVSILGFLGFLYISLLSSVCAFFLLTWGLAKTNVVQANLLTYIEPAVAASLAVPLLSERISFSFIIGTCLVVLGVYWGTLGKQEHHHAHHKSHRA